MLRRGRRKKYRMRWEKRRFEGKKEKEKEKTSLAGERSVPNVREVYTRSGVAYSEEKRVSSYSGGGTRKKETLKRASYRYHTVLEKIRITSVTKEKETETTWGSKGSMREFGSVEVRKRRGKEEVAHQAGDPSTAGSWAEKIVFKKKGVASRIWERQENVWVYLRRTFRGGGGGKESGEGGSFNC